MIYTVFDVETTGLRTGTDCVLQFAYLLFDSLDNTIVSADSFYLWDESYTWSDDAYKVHKISKDFLRSLPKSEMKVKYGKMFKALSAANLMTYNGNSFDIPFCDNFLKRYAVQPYLPASQTDVMLLARQAFGKRFKLVNLVDHLEIPEEAIKAMQEAHFGVSTGAHDATYDVISTLLCYIRLRGAGLAV